jgi:hypothetical protein
VVEQEGIEEEERFDDEHSALYAVGAGMAAQNHGSGLKDRLNAELMLCS